MDKEAVIKKTLEELIEIGWITVNEHLVLDAVAKTIRTRLQVAEREYKDHQEKELLFELLHRHFPEKFSMLFKEKGEK